MAGFLLALVLSASTPQAEAQSAVASFLDAFRAMDQRRFDEFFASDATMFFPDGPFPQGRVEGKTAILSTFHDFFALMKKSGRTSLSIDPIEPRMQVIGNMVLVSFRLDGGDSVGRRSILFAKSNGRWKIVHFHASTRDK